MNFNPAWIWRAVRDKITSRTPWQELQSFFVKPCLESIYLHIMTIHFLRHPLILNSILVMLKLKLKLSSFPVLIFFCWFNVKKNLWKFEHMSKLGLPYLPEDGKTYQNLTIWNVTIWKHFIQWLVSGLKLFQIFFNMKYFQMVTGKWYENYPDWMEFWSGMNKFHTVTGYWYENFILSPYEMSPSEVSSKYYSKEVISYLIQSESFRPRHLWNKGKIFGS